MGASKREWEKVELERMLDREAAGRAVRREEEEELLESKVIRRVPVRLIDLLRKRGA
jgi:hypothetical protein